MCSMQSVRCIRFSGDLLQTTATIRQLAPETPWPGTTVCSTCQCIICPYVNSTGALVSFGMILQALFSSNMQVGETLPFEGGC